MPKDIFTPRAISPEVRDARPYVPYESVEDVFNADPSYRDLAGAQLADLSKTVKASPGWVMTRHPMPGADPIFAELRPDDPVEQQPTTHTHGARASKVHGDHLYLHTHSENERVQAEHDAAREVCYIQHRHRNEKKYTFPMGDGRAARLDIHPMALERFERGRVPFAFYALEGVLKADALLSAGHPAVSVPGVTLWYGAQLEFLHFADRYLDGVKVLVVSDSDFETNPNVVFNTILCAESLQRAGIDAWPVFPPPVDDDPKTGVDDLLRAFGPESTWRLRVASVHLPAGFKDWAEEQLAAPGHGRQREGVANALSVLQWLIVHSTARGDVVANSAAVARHRDMERRTVNRAIDRLADAGILRLTQPPRRRRRPSWVKKGGWESEPARYTIADPALRVDIRTRSLAGVMGVPAEVAG